MSESFPNRPYWIYAQIGTPVAMGDPGMGKTQQFLAFCRAVGRKPYVLVPSSRDSTDFYGCPFSAETTIGRKGKTKTVRTMQIASPEWAVKCWDDDRWAILLDELTTAMPIIQAALLRIIAEKHVGEIPLPDDILILAAANPPETAPNGIDLSPPLANRVYHHKWEADTKGVLEGYAAGMQFGEPRFDRVPDDWEKHLIGVGGMVAAFHEHLPGRLDAYPDDPAKQSGPWPSQRSWANGIRAMAAAEACGAPKAVSLALLCGLVGDPAAREYFEWADSLDLPDAEQVLKKATTAFRNHGDLEFKAPSRPDKVLAFLGAIAQRVHIKASADRWHGAMMVFEQMADKHLEAVVAKTKLLLDPKVRPEGAKMNKEFIQKVLPKLRIALDI